MSTRFADRAQRRPPVAAGIVLVTRDAALADHVSALAGAAGARLTVQQVAGGAGLREATLMLIGLDVAEPLPRVRPGAVLVARSDGADPPDGIWRQAVELGVDHVAVLPEAEPWLLNRFIDAASPVARAPVVAVLGGRGGAGASTLAVAMAATAARSGLRPVLLDADPLGGGLDLALGVERDDGLRWPDLPPGPGRLPAGFLVASLPDAGGISLLSCARQQGLHLSAEQVGAVLDAATRDADLVVVDLPRRITPVEHQVLTASRRVLLVVPAEVRAAAAGAQVVAGIEAHVADLRVVVRGPAPTGLIAEAVADALALPLQGELRPEPGLSAALDRGEAAALRPRGPLVLLCRRVLADLLEPA